jgi:hypothetical protein
MDNTHDVITSGILRFGIGFSVWFVAMLLLIVWNKAKSEIISDDYEDIWPVFVFMNFFKLKWGNEDDLFAAYMVVLLLCGFLVGLMVAFWKLSLIVWFLFGLYKGIVYFLKKEYESRKKWNHKK